MKPFAKADAPKLRYLNDDEARRLVNGCAAGFRPLVQAALLTGARYAELAALEARDFDRQSQTLWLRETKAGVARAVYLEGEGVRLFDQATAGKAAGELIFPRTDGKRWGPSQQARPLAQACLAAKLEPTGFHDLRRTYGGRLALRGVPMAVIAEALGHADERMTRRHYAHLSKSYVADTVRGAVAGHRGIGRRVYEEILGFFEVLGEGHRNEGENGVSYASWATGTFKVTVELDLSDVTLTVTGLRFDRVALQQSLGNRPSARERRRHRNPQPRWSPCSQARRDHFGSDDPAGRTVTRRACQLHG